MKTFADTQTIEPGVAALAQGAPQSPSEPMISIQHLDKSFRAKEGLVHAVNDISLTVPRGELVTLLGPSGCGKTTILRCVAGLEKADGGEIRIGQRAVFSAHGGINLQPAHRRIGMVFQSYAIWPHMSVFDNVAYPLKRGKFPRKEIAERTEATLEMLKLEHLAKRPATALSGGQQQRVAVARALVSEAEVILFDEPLSNLDAKLRKEVRQEIREIQLRLGITVLYVTHDQEEAMAVSDTILVLDSGVIKDAGTPERIYSAPGDIFSARFLGESNVIPGTLHRLDSRHCMVDTLVGEFNVDPDTLPPLDGSGDVLLTARPEHLRLTDGEGAGLQPGCSSFHGVVRATSFLGPFAEVTVQLAHGHDVTVRVSGASPHRIGDPVTVSVPLESIVVHASPAAV